MFVTVNYICEMKILSIVFSIYVMLLTGVACADELRFSDNDNAEIASYNIHVEFCGDHCSPFCACACCVGFTNAPGIIVQPITKHVVQTSFFYLDEHFKASKYSFLQPPRA
ncbi:DUF6660 family protein [Pedobacter sp. CAN_A7]|uniref:DUF6660 family protein n=1 Tax=Pedobacter sp. CAN_A7 TaxID=2787722 RepID=UPI003FA7E35F